MTVIRRDTVPETEAVSTYPGPYDLGRGALFYRTLSDAGGLTQFGAALERLEPGGRTSQLHWHEDEDEFVYLIEGRLTVIEDSAETLIGPGDAACWKAGTAVGHSLRNDGDAPALYLIVGARVSGDVHHYPGLDLRDEPHGDGRPLRPSRRHAVDAHR